MLHTKQSELPRLIDYCLDILSRIDVEVIKECSHINGYCILKEEKRLYIDDSLSDIEKFLVLIEVLSMFDLEKIFINPVIRDYLQKYRENTLGRELIHMTAGRRKISKKYMPRPVVIKRES